MTNRQIMLYTRCTKFKNLKIAVNLIETEKNHLNPKMFQMDIQTDMWNYSKGTRKLQYNTMSVVYI